LTYDRTILPDRYLPVRWNPRTKRLVADRFARKVAAQEFSGAADLGAAMAEVNRLIAAADELTVLILNDGTRALEGTAFDIAINAAYPPVSSGSVEPSSLYLTTLTARAGQMIGWSVQRTQPVRAAPSGSKSKQTGSVNQPVWTRETGAGSKPMQKPLRGELPLPPDSNGTVVEGSPILEPGLPGTISDREPELAAAIESVTEGAQNGEANASKPMPVNATEPRDSGIGSETNTRDEPPPEAVEEISGPKPAVQEPTRLNDPSAAANEAISAAVEPRPVNANEPSDSGIDSETNTRDEPPPETVEKAATERLLEAETRAPEAAVPTIAYAAETTSQTAELGAAIPEAAVTASAPGSNPRKFLVLGGVLLVIATGSLAWFARSGREKGRASLISRSLDVPQK
jgi:hypothetical protein